MKTRLIRSKTLVNMYVIEGKRFFFWRELTTFRSEDIDGALDFFDKYNKTPFVIARGRKEV